jgi:hypothetical protein
MAKKTMSLIWAEDMTGDKALAPALIRYMLATVQVDDSSLPLTDRGMAVIEKEDAKKDYEALTDEAEKKLKSTAQQNKPRTHILIVGVGRYSDNKISAVTTSIHGAIAFAEWTLNNFQHLERPLGSLAMLLSLPNGMPTWKPKDAPSIYTATKLGLKPGDDLPLEPATFENIKNAFGSMVERGRTSSDNAVIFYFAGHGFWNNHPYVLPEDAVIADDQKGFDNLIDPYLTLQNMPLTQPETQVFFIDSCQEILPEAIVNLSRQMGKPLWDYPNAGVLSKRDNIIYYGSYPGQLAVGHEDQAPFFTQELLECLDKRSARNRVGKYWAITSQSLSQAMEAASTRKSELLEKEDMLKFSSLVPGAKSFESVLCHVSLEPEVFVHVQCLPLYRMSDICPYVDQQGIVKKRQKPRKTEWVTDVIAGNCIVGAAPVPPDDWADKPQSYNLRPPVEFVTIQIPD